MIKVLALVIPLGALVIAAHMITTTMYDAFGWPGFLGMAVAATITLWVGMNFGEGSSYENLQRKIRRMVREIEEFRAK